MATPWLKKIDPGAIAPLAAASSHRASEAPLSRAAGDCATRLMRRPNACSPCANLGRQPLRVDLTIRVSAPAAGAPIAVPMPRTHEKELRP